MITIEELKDIDRAWKPANADEEWGLATRYYEDQGKDRTIARLNQLKVGLFENPKPIQISLLRRIIDRISSVYDKAPTRWLADLSGERLPEDHPEHEAMVRAIDRSQTDLGWRRVDRMRSLNRQCIVRRYPSDARGSVVMRVFNPFDVIRSPNPGEPDLISQDACFALRLASVGDDEVWEQWQNFGTHWEMRVVNQDGRHVGRQPFEQSGGVNPYGIVPCQQIFDEVASGRAWLPPRESRTSFVEAINAIANDLWALVTREAHSQVVVTTDDPAGVPTETGPGVTWALSPESSASVLSSNPKIAESNSVLESLIKLWSISEDLSASEFDKKQVVTGAALKVQERALIARREAQVPLAREDERVGWQQHVAVSNLHASNWGAPLLDPTLEMDIDIGDVDIPVDGRELHETMARAMVMGIASPIDAIMAQHGSTRAQALLRFERVAKDLEIYGPAGDMAGVPDGPAMSEIVQGPKDSVTANLQAVETDAA